MRVSLGRIRFFYMLDSHCSPEQLKVKIESWCREIQLLSPCTSFGSYNVVLCALKLNFILLVLKLFGRMTFCQYTLTTSFIRHHTVINGSISMLTSQ